MCLNVIQRKIANVFYVFFHVFCVLLTFCVVVLLIYSAV